jgi:SAM-dependent methyltransferase
MEDPKILERMRADWNQRAGEDAYYYVAFGRHRQDDEEFFASAADVVRALSWELKRLPARTAALEIGCGPGRLMRPMSRHFSEIHGVDVSDEMIRMARQHLQNTSNAHPHHGSGSDLAMFSDAKFDFVYSYAVFQHIPSADVVFHYLREAWRVLKPGGILRCQINGLSRHAKQYDTWSGVRISPDEIYAFTREQNFQLLALENIWTQYMWITCRKPSGAGLQQTAGAAIRNISNAHTGEAVAPASGALAALSLWIERLPSDCDLNHLSVTADGLACRLTFIGAPEKDGVSQVNAALPEGLRTGFVPVEVFWRGESLCPPAWVRIMPPGPAVPRVVSVTDGINIISGTRIVTGSVKVFMTDVAHPEEFHASVDGGPVSDVDTFCTDPITRSYEFNFKLPEHAGNGPHEVGISIGRRLLGRVAIEVAG